MRTQKLEKPAPIMRRAWFDRDGAFDGSPSSEGVEQVKQECAKRDWTGVQIFKSCNDNEGVIALVFDSRMNILVIGGKPHVQQLTPADAMEFYATMTHESEEGEDMDGKPEFYKFIAAQLKGGAR